MPLDPLLAFALMLLFWTAAIAYTLYMAARQRRDLLRSARPGPDQAS